MGNGFGSGGFDDIAKQTGNAMGHTPRKVLNFWMKEGTSDGKVLFLTNVPFTFYQHSFQIAGKWNALSIACTGQDDTGSPDPDNCEFCKMLMDPAHAYSSKKGHSRSYVGTFSIIDRRPWKNKDGEVIKDEKTGKVRDWSKKILIAKKGTLEKFAIYANNRKETFDAAPCGKCDLCVAAKGRRSPDCQNKVQRPKFSGLIDGKPTGSQYHVARTTADKSVSVGDVWEFDKTITLFEEFIHCFPAEGIPAKENFEAKTHKELLREFLTPHNMKEVYEPTEERIKGALATLKGAVQSVAKVQQYEKDEAAGADAIDW